MFFKADIQLDKNGNIKKISSGDRVEVPFKTIDPSDIEVLTLFINFLKNGFNYWIVRINTYCVIDRRFFGIRQCSNCERSYLQADELPCSHKSIKFIKKA